MFVVEGIWHRCSTHSVPSAGASVDGLRSIPVATLANTSLKNTRPLAGDSFDRVAATSLEPTALGSRDLGGYGQRTCALLSVANRPLDVSIERPIPLFDVAKRRSARECDTVPLLAVATRCSVRVSVVL